MIRARFRPSPNTVCVAPCHRWQPRQPAAASRRRGSVGRSGMYSRALSRHQSAAKRDSSRRTSGRPIVAVKASKPGTSIAADVPSLAQAGERLADRVARHQQRGHRVDDEAEAELADAVEPERRRLAALDPVEQQRRVGERVGHGGDLVLALGRLDEQHVRARVAVAPRALERGVEPLDRARVGAGDDHELRRAAGLDRGAHLLDHLARRDHLLAVHVAAALGRHLVLEVEPGDAGRLVLADRAHHVERVAVAVVGVGDHRDPDGLHEPPRVAGHLVEREQADVGPPEQRRRRAEARQVDGREARLLDQPRRQAVVGARRQHRLAAGQQLAQRGPAAVALRQLRHPRHGLTKARSGTLWR